MMHDEANDHGIPGANATGGPGQGGMGKMILRVMAVVLGSVLFLPVSCTVTLMAVGSSGLFSLVEVRDLTHGEEIPVFFPMMAELPGGEPRFLRFPEWTTLKNENSSLSLRPSQDSGEVRSGWAVESWQVIQKTAQGPIIEVRHQDDDITLMGRYQVLEDGNPVPLTIEINGMGQAMSFFVKSLPIALAVSLLILVWGRRLRRKMR